jgi:hypothetical protein
MDAIEAQRSGEFSIGTSADYPCQLSQQRPGLFQDWRVKSFCEPAVYRHQQIMGFHGFALLTPESGEAGGGPQLEELRALPLSCGDGLKVVPLSPELIASSLQKVARHLIKHKSFVYPLVGGLD